MGSWFYEVAPAGTVQSQKVGSMGRGWRMRPSLLAAVFSHSDDLWAQMSLPAASLPQ